MVETKTLTLTVREVVEEPEFRFDSYNPPLDTREIFPVGAPWPSVTKEYDPGDSVYVHYAVKNVGPIAATWKITVKDLDTGDTLTTYTGPLEPGFRFKTKDAGAYVGKMPNKDWRLSFTVTP